MKKKCLGGLKLFFVLSFILLLNIYSTCCADEIDYTDFEIPIEFWQALIDYNNNNTSLQHLGGSILTSPEMLKTQYDTYMKSSIKSAVSGIGGDERNLMFCFYNTMNYPNTTSNQKCEIGITVMNNTVGNVNNYSTPSTTSSTFFGGVNWYTGGQVFLVGKITIMKNGNISYNNFTSINGTLSNTTMGWIYNDSQIIDDGLTLQNVPFFGVNQKPLNILLFKKSGSSDFNNYFLENYYNINTQIQPDPENPSGETPILPSGDDDGFGTIDYTNQLNSINNNISTQGTSIINNQNENTKKIINAINVSNENYWGSSGDLTGSEQESFISDSIDSLTSTLSGELHSNPVFQEMENAENIFLDFFRNQEDESYYDLIVSWDSVAPLITMNGGSTILSNQSIVSGDSFNISALCRENSTLGNIQQLIRIIFNFSCLIALLWQIYNLILSTLGIDNPYLYEDSQITDIVNVDTGEVRSYNRRYRRTYKLR